METINITSSSRLVLLQSVLLLATLVMSAQCDRLIQRKAAAVTFWQTITSTGEAIVIESMDGLSLAVTCFCVRAARRVSQDNFPQGDNKVLFFFFLHSGWGAAGE